MVRREQEQQSPIREQRTRQDRQHAADEGRHKQQKADDRQRHGHGTPPSGAREGRVGAGGVTAFVFLVLLKVAFLSQLAPEAALPALVGIPAAARFGTLISIFQFPYAREQGLGRAFVTYAPAHTVEKALVLALVPVFFCGPFYLALLGAAMLLSLWANSRISRKLGGVTGDTYGAVLEGSEMALLLMTAVGSKLADFLL